MEWGFTIYKRVRQLVNYHVSQGLKLLVHGECTNSVRHPVWRARGKASKGSKLTPLQAKSHVFNVSRPD